MNLVMALGILTVFECSVRLYRALRRHAPFWGGWVLPSPKHLAFKGHPYALYVKKPNAGGRYPSNSLGYAGTREYPKARVPNSVRLFFVGGSTVESHEPQEGPDSSWPAKVEDRLSSRWPGYRVECINAGMSGYTSAESLAEFMFRGVDLKPDLLVVYHNVNDAWTCQMVDGFAADYSHARRQKSWKIAWVHRVPQVPWWAGYQLVRSWMMSRFGRANSLIDWIADPPWEPVRAFDARAVQAFRRNIINLVVVARQWGCATALVKWECDWSAQRLPSFLMPRPGATEVFFEYLRANNETLREIASEEAGCHYLDVGAFAPEHFTDTVHFSAAGLREMSRRIADGITPIVQSIIDERCADTPHPVGAVQAAEGR